MKNCYLTISIFIFVSFTTKSFCQKNDVKDNEYLIDQSGIKYKTVKIGSNIWTAENFKGNRYANGDPIEEYKIGISKSNEYNEPLFCILENNNYVYSWAAINSRKGIAPLGWHVPSKIEWEELISNCKNFKDLLSINGWGKNINAGGYYETIICPNCQNWNSEYRSKVACHRCKDTRRITGKYISTGTISFNGTNRLGFNLKHLGYLSSDLHEMKRDGYWASKSETTNIYKSFVLFIYTKDWGGFFYPTPSVEEVYYDGGMLSLRFVKNK